MSEWWQGFAWGFGWCLVLVVGAVLGAAWWAAREWTPNGPHWWIGD